MILNQAANLQQFNERFKRIMVTTDSDSQKDLDLARLMTDMETVFQIPMMANSAYKKNNPEVMSLYRRVSMSRRTI